MEDIGIDIAAEVAKVLAKPAIRQGQYLFCVNKVIRNLDNEKEKLISKRDSIQSLVEQAIQRTEIIEDAVTKWLNDVRSLLEEVEKLEQDVKESGCFQGWCPTWRRYRLCREISKKTERITTFKSREMFQPFSHPAPFPGIEYISSENFTYFESTKEAYDQLLEALQDGNTYMIGLYGMGGSGKTTLATEVGKKALEQKLFDWVIPPVTISQTPNIRRIQGEMADMLKLKLEEESEEGRARRLWLKLEAETRVLIIVDDVWAKFDLAQIGIRLEDNKKPNFKILLTTRERRVCDLMNCQRNFVLNLLSVIEGWRLFQKHAGIGEGSSSNLLKVAREVSDECKGLPIAIKAVGSSLKGRGDDDYKATLQSLRNSEPFDDHEEEGMSRAYTCLKLSYDYLRNQVAETLLLICCMFPEDNEIYIEDLIRYGVGLGLCGNFNSFDSRRSGIKAGINKLIDSCLLLHSGQRERCVKMHDMVRHVGLWIASKSEDRKILVNVADDLNALAENEAIKDYFAVSSWYNKTNLISNQLDAPKLQILLLETKNQNSQDFSYASFDGVKELKVMSILNSHYCRFLLLLESTQWLTNLRTLRLSGWNLGDLSFLISLTRLEALDLRTCNFTELPKGMEKLNRLKLLDLSGCELSENFNYEALGSFSQLEELYAVGLIFPSEVMKDIVTLPNLQRFWIPGHIQHILSIDDKERTRVLTLHDFNIYDIDASKQNLLQRAEHVYLQRLYGGCKNVTPDMVQVVGGMDKLTNFSIWGCSEIECLINTTSGSFQVDTLLPKLVKLELSQMDNLKAVVSLFSVSVAQSLQQLEELSIQGCKELKHIIKSEGEGGTNTGDNSHLRFPNLKKLSVSSCPKLEFIFPISFALQGLLQLQKIQISEAAQLEVIFRHNSEYNIGKMDQIMFPSLEKLQLEKLPSFVNVFQGFSFEAPKLKKLSTHECPKIAPILGGTQMGQVFWLITTSSSLQAFLNLEELHLTKSRAEGIFQLQVEGETSNNSEGKPWESNLSYLMLCNLPELRFIWNGFSKYLSLENLGDISLVECPKLKTIFSSDIVRCLPNLWNLSILNCEELEEIISSDSDNTQLRLPPSRPKQEVCFPQLYSIEVKQCNKLKCLFYDSMTCHFPKVGSLEIEECSQLEQAFGFKIEGGDKSSQREASEDGHLISCQHVTTQGQVFWLITTSSSLQSFLNLDILRLTKSRAECIFQLQVEGEISSNNEWTPLNSSLHYLRLHDLPELRFIWKDFSKFLSLEKLEEVSLVDCPQLKTIFSPCIVRCLPKLKMLLISNCEKLEEIMSSDLENAQLRHPTACPQQEVCFPRLIKIEVKQCNKLKCLFYDSMACHFPELESLEIEECFQIEQVFGSKGRADDESSQKWANEDGDRILLPELRELVLKSLPIFFEISRGFNLSQPMHKYLVTDCPSYNSTFAEASSSYQHTTKQGEHSDGEF